MPNLTNDFQSLPPEYQQIIQLAQEKNDITIAPLQLLVGGWSGAVVYLVSVARNETKRVEHCILKLDRKSKNAKSDEVTRHNTVMEKAAPEFARAHIAELVFDRVEQDGAIAIFYRIAGESLQKYRPLSNYERQSQLKTIFTETNRILLSEWNQDSTFEQAVHPRKTLEKWLGFRLDEGGNIEHFIQERANANVAGFLVNGQVFPNPLLYARKTEPWGNVRAMDVATGFIHGDLNTNNILVRFADDKETLAGYYLGQTIPDIDRYFLVVVGAVILVSALPAGIHIAKEYGPTVHRLAAERLGFGRGSSKLARVPAEVEPDAPEIHELRDHHER